MLSLHLVALMLRREAASLHASFWGWHVREPWRQTRVVSLSLSPSLAPSRSLSPTHIGVALVVDEDVVRMKAGLFSKSQTNESY